MEKGEGKANGRAVTESHSATMLQGCVVLLGAPWCCTGKGREDNRCGGRGGKGEGGQGGEGNLVKGEREEEEQEEGKDEGVGNTARRQGKRW